MRIISEGFECSLSRFGKKFFVYILMGLMLKKIMLATLVDKIASKCINIYHYLKDQDITVKNYSQPHMPNDKTCQLEP